MYSGEHSPGPRPPKFYLHPPQFRHHQPPPPPRRTTPVALTAPEGIISHNRPRTPPTTQRNTTLRHTLPIPQRPRFYPVLGAAAAAAFIAVTRTPVYAGTHHAPRTSNGIRNSSASASRRHPSHPRHTYINYKLKKTTNFVS